MMRPQLPHPGKGGNNRLYPIKLPEGEVRSLQGRAWLMVNLVDSS